MLRFERWSPDTAASSLPTAGEFPYFVQPLADEALYSWILRLATRLGVSVRSLATESFGVEDCGPRSHWWCRPHPWVLKRISQRTGVDVDRLWGMTLHPLAPCYRNDEQCDRFDALRYSNYGPGYRRYTHVVCPLCLQEDAEPYLRWTWLLGWMTVCPQHQSVLITHCVACRTKCHVAALSTAADFCPTDCTRCGEHLVHSDNRRASPSVLRLQARLLKGKCEGVTELDGLGEFTWAELIALLDVLQGMYATAGTEVERARCEIAFRTPNDAETSEPPYRYSVRHATLRFLAWLTDGWPRSTGSRLAQDLLAAWLSGRGNGISRQFREVGIPWSHTPDDFGPAIRKRLAAILD